MLLMLCMGVNADKIWLNLVSISLDTKLELGQIMQY